MLQLEHLWLTAEPTELIKSLKLHNMLHVFGLTLKPQQGMIYAP